MLYAGNYLSFIKREDQIDRLLERAEKEIRLYKKEMGMTLGNKSITR